MSADHLQANTNGRLHPAHEPSLSPLNRGFLYGDAIYEVWRTYHGVLFAWEEHWQRLLRSAAALYFAPLPSRAQMWAEIARTVAEFRRTAGSGGDLYVRLQVTRGAGPIGLDVALADRPDFVILVQKNKGLSEGQLRAGLRLSLATGLRRNPATSLDPAWKTGNYLNNILCLREARARGADEVVIANLNGFVTEAAVANIAFVRGGAVVTPPLSAGILGGVTRELLIREIGPRAGVTVREENIRPEEFSSMDECFLLSTTKDLSPVGAIDSVRFRVAPDSVTMRLKEAFATHAQAYAEAHPELRVDQQR